MLMFQIICITLAMIKPSFCHWTAPFFLFSFHVKFKRNKLQILDSSGRSLRQNRKSSGFHKAPDSAWAKTSKKVPESEERAGSFGACGKSEREKMPWRPSLPRPFNIFLFSFLLKFTWLLANVIKAISSSLPFLSFSYYAAILPWLVLLYNTHCLQCY